MAIQFLQVHTITAETSRHLHLLPIENSLAHIPKTERTVDCEHSYESQRFGVLCASSRAAVLTGPRFAQLVGGTHLKQVIARLELAVWRLLAQRLSQLSRRERGILTQLAIATGLSHARQVRFRLVSIRSLRAFCLEASSVSGTSPPLPKYISLAFARETLCVADDSCAL